MKTTAPSLALAAGLAAAALILPPLTQADEAGASPDASLLESHRALAKVSGQEQPIPRDAPWAPTVPEGTDMTPDIEAAILLIHVRLIEPMREHSDSRVIMSRALIRMDIEYHLALTAPTESRLPFDVYQRHRRGGWEKIASGVCHPGMDSIKVAMPDTGVMVDPEDHPLFAAALISARRQE